MPEKECAHFALRLRSDLMEFLKKESYEQDKSINKLIGECVRAYKKKIEKRLKST